MSSSDMEAPETPVIAGLSAGFPDGAGLFRALKSRLVGGVIVWFFPCFAGIYGGFNICPPIYPPTRGASELLALKPLDRY